MVNLLIILALLLLELDSNLRQTIIYANILILVFNLMPIYPLDGGRILKGLLTLRYDNRVSEDLVNKLSNVLLILLTAASSILIIYFRNLAIFFVIMYLWIIVIKENRNYRIRKRVYDVITEK